MCPHRIFGSCFQWFDLEKVVRQKQNFSPNIIIGVSIWIVICELNKVYEMKEFVVGESVQSLYDKKKKVVQNVQFCTPFVQLVQ